ncbi:rhomboid family intramembrane serine protease [Microvirga pudoricolor]|uniref:rhomboid family intramembrane serine protease n=1 Tax=Microvirga pudoricolor TaxID=2778729 RepID=UPI00194DC1A0|nr:rhomboid family intramembrane serine protease [Microvirga pudoricolor]MBM6596002.1 rhomboid family intramembrane serine protease [Microvirga pudoricolor]
MPLPQANPREPIFNLPAVVLASLALLVGIHALRDLVLSDAVNFDILIDWAVIPARWAAAYGGVPPDEILNALSSSPGDEPSLPLELARYILAQGSGHPLSGLTYALLHGSWTHVLMNGVWLAAFGTPVARRCGALRFLLLAAAAALAGAIFYTVVHPLQVIPLIGASAAVSGMMAAAAWFMFSPPVWMLEGRISEPHERPRESLAGLVTNRQVLLFLGVWLLINYFSAAFAEPLGVTDASIAWEAHIGGFLAGLLLFPLVDPLPPRERRASA